MKVISKFQDHEMISYMGISNAAVNRVGRGMGIMLVLTAAGHFLVPTRVDQLVPPFLPGEPRVWTYLSGLAEIFIAVMIFAPLGKKFAGKSIRLWGAYSAFALFIAVFPANINMAIDWSSRDMPEPLLAYARLPLQFGLFYWAWALANDIENKSQTI